MTDFKVQRMVKTKSTHHIRSQDELLAESTQRNPCSAPSSSKLGVEVASTSTKSTSQGTSSSSSSDSLSRHSSSKGASTRSLSHEEPSAPCKSVLKKKGRSLVGLVPEIVGEGLEFPGNLPARTLRTVRVVTFSTPRSFLH